MCLGKFSPHTIVSIYISWDGKRFSSVIWKTLIERLERESFFNEKCFPTFSRKCETIDNRRHIATAPLRWSSLSLLRPCPSHYLKRWNVRQSFIPEWCFPLATSSLHYTQSTLKVSRLLINFLSVAHNYLYISFPFFADYGAPSSQSTDLPQVQTRLYTFAVRGRESHYKCLCP